MPSIKLHIHLAHANGYPPGCYRVLLEGLQDDYACRALPFRPLLEDADSGCLGSWHDLAEDLGADLTGLGPDRPWIGMGHSLGAIVSLLAAIRNPGLFSHLVLLDPVILPWRWYLAGQLVPLRLRHHLVPLSRQALRRRDYWPDALAARDHLRRKAIFCRIPEAVFDDLITAMLQPDPRGGVCLAYARLWEARIYNTVTSPYDALKRLRIPFLILRGAQSDTIRPEVWAKVKRMNPQGTFIEMADCGHLLPFERPEATARLIKDWLAGLT